MRINTEEPEKKHEDTQIVVQTCTILVFFVVILFPSFDFGHVSDMTCPIWFRPPFHMAKNDCLLPEPLPLLDLCHGRQAARNVDNEKVKTKTKRHWKCRKAEERLLQAPRYDILCWVLSFFMILLLLNHILPVLSCPASSRCWFRTFPDVSSCYSSRGLELQIVRRRSFWDSRSEGSDKKKPARLFELCFVAFLLLLVSLQIAGVLGRAHAMLGFRLVKFSAKNR